MDVFPGWRMENLNRFRLCTVFAVLLAGAVSAARAQTTVIQTNLDCWVQELDLSLTALTNGVPVTNGIIAHLATGTTFLDAQALLRAINGKNVLAVGKALTNFTTVHQHITNHYSLAYPTFTPATFTNNAAARIVLLSPLGAEDFTPIIAVCPSPKFPQMYYSLEDYLQIATVAFDGRTNGGTVTSGRLDIAHGLASTSINSIRRFTFNSNTFTDAPPTGTFFDVQGFATEQESDLVEHGLVVNGAVSTGMVSSVAGTGQVSGAAFFGVVRGTITLTNGKHVVQ